MLQLGDLAGERHLFIFFENVDREVKLRAPQKKSESVRIKFSLENAAG